LAYSGIISLPAFAYSLSLGLCYDCASVMSEEYSDSGSNSSRFTMQEVNAQMALRLHQITGEPLAHCSYLLDQTKGDYETALKILERILAQRRTNPTGSTVQASTDETEAQSASLATAESDLELRVQRLENQLGLLAQTLEMVNGKLTLLVDKLSDASDREQK